jgi:hypothetical protein
LANGQLLICYRLKGPALAFEVDDVEGVAREALVRPRDPQKAQLILMQRWRLVVVVPSLISPSDNTFLQDYTASNAPAAAV